MSDRITRKMVERAFELFAKTVPAEPGHEWVLEYGFAGYFGLYQRTPNRGGCYSSRISSQLGKAREAFTRLHAMIDCAEHLAQLQEGR